MQYQIDKYLLITSKLHLKTVLQDCILNIPASSTKDVFFGFIPFDLRK